LIPSLFTKIYDYIVTHPIDHSKIALALISK
jgi:hypothetical protein